MNIIQKILIGFIVSMLAIMAFAVGVLVYDIVTSIRAWMKRRREYSGKEEPHNGISEFSR